MLTGWFVPGTSLLHRVRAGHKLVALLVFSAALLLPWKAQVLGGSAVLVAGGFFVAGFTVKHMWQMVRPVLVWVVLLAALTWWAATWQDALVSSAILVIAVLAAGLVTLTTPTDDLMMALVVVLKPFQRWGAKPDVVAMALAMALRSVPVLVGISQTVQHAQAARGARRNPRAYFVPLLIRTIRHADLLGQALFARGFDDPEPEGKPRRKISGRITARR